MVREHHSGCGSVGGFGLRVRVVVTAASGITAVTVPSHDSAEVLLGGAVADNASGSRAEVSLGVHGGEGRWAVWCLVLGVWCLVFCKTPKRTYNSRVLI